MNILTGNQTKQYHLLALKGALRLEIAGMRHSSGRRASVIIRKILTDAGIKPSRNLATLLQQYQSWLTG